MPHLRPIKRTLFEKYLRAKGCYLKRIKGGHIIYSRDDLNRPIIFQSKSEIPITHLKTNLRTLGVSVEQFLNDLEEI